jgi:hypothetical protein
LGYVLLNCNGGLRGESRAILLEKEEEIKKIVLDILQPVISKQVNEIAFRNLFNIMDEIKDIMKEETQIPKSLIKLILYI